MDDAPRRLPAGCVIIEDADGLLLRTRVGMDLPACCNATPFGEVCDGDHNRRTP
jgi:hypothetical protein